MRHQAFTHEGRYSTAEFLGNLGTHSDHLLLAPERRDALFSAIEQACERHGGIVEIAYRTDLYWTRPA
jgi:hypothetical protein